MELMYITNKPEIAKIADRSGVERIWIDLERRGKEKRQKGYDSVKSCHTISDISIIKPFLERAKLQVRINPIHNNSKKEIEDVIVRGADIIMLPYYKTVEEVQQFSSFVDGRIKTVLLLETKEANNCLEETLLVQGIDEIHIGLNDLHISYGQKFMFELLADGTVESICKKIKAFGKPYGFGGIARLGEGLLPAEKVVAEHYRLGSTRVILSRSFCNPDTYDNVSKVAEIFDVELKNLRQYERSISSKDDEYFLYNYKNIRKTVDEIVRKYWSK